MNEGVSTYTLPPDIQQCDTLAPVCVQIRVQLRRLECLWVYIVEISKVWVVSMTREPPVNDMLVGSVSPSHADYTLNQRESAQEDILQHTKECASTHELYTRSAPWLFSGPIHVTGSSEASTYACKDNSTP